LKYYWLKKWKKKLGIKELINFEFIPREIVDNHYQVGYRLVGICGHTIYHDRRLKEDDIIHELLHFKHPNYKETTIRKKVLDKSIKV
jgi:hypothetical protein